MAETCWHCHTTPYGQTVNLHQQVFNDKTISTMYLNPCNTRPLTSSTCNVPDRGASDYRNLVEINFCPMCGRDLR